MYELTHSTIVQFQLFISYYYYYYVSIQYEYDTKHHDYYDYSYLSIKIYTTIVVYCCIKAFILFLNLLFEWI